MKFNGLNKSTGLMNMNDGDSPFALNAVYAKNNNIEGTSNEEGFISKYEHSSPTIGIITTNEDRDIIFSGQVDTADIPEIGQLKNGVYTTLIKDNILGFKNPIKGQYYFNNLGELIIQWWDGVYDDSNVPKILNVDCIPFKLNLDFSLVNATDIELLNITPKRIVPDYTLVKLNDGGGKLKTGAYFFTFAQQYPDSTIGNFNKVSSVVFVNKDISEVYNNFNGCPGGTDTQKSITIKIQNISSYITKITLGVIKKINGIYTAITIPDIPVINSEVIYTYTGYNEIESSLEEVLISTANIIKAQTGTQLDNKAYLGNVVTPEFPNIQSYVNNINVKWTFEDSIFLSQKTNSLKDMNFIFDRRQFKSNEVYALYLIAYLPTGESMAFNIPGRAPELGINFIDEEGNLFVTDENSLISSILPQNPTSIAMNEAVAINSTAKLHEIFNTAKNDGTVGYWENQDELYPDIDCSDIKDVDGNVIGTLRNQKIRHHKLPSYSQLKVWEKDVFVGKDLAHLKFLKLSIDDNTLPGISLMVTEDFDYLDFGHLDPTDTTNKTFILDKECNLRLKFHMEALGLNVIDTGIIQITQVGSNSTILYRREYHDGSDTSFTDYINVRGKKGDKIKLEAFNWTSGGINPTTYIEFYDWSFERYEVTGMLLGVKLENIEIPLELRQKFVRFELGFAERTPGNSTISASTPAQGSNKLRMKSADIFTFRSNLDFDYIESQVTYKTEEGVTDLLHEFKDWGVRKSYDSQYVPGFTNSVENNERGGEYIYTRVTTGLPNVSDFDMALAYRYLDLKRYKKNAYLSRNYQKIIATGEYFGIGVIGTGPMYNGDTFVNLMGWYDLYQIPEVEETLLENESRVIPLRETVSNRRYRVTAYVYPLETIVNTGYMSQELDARYALAYPDMTKPAKYSFDNNGTLDPPAIENGVQFSQIDNLWEYNNDYHALLNFLEIPIFICEDSCNLDLPTKFPYRIYRSIVVNKDSNNLNWRFFKSGDYYELPKNKGAIWVLRSMNRSLLINTLYSFFVASPKDRLATNTVDAYLAVGDIFDRPPEEIVTVDGGYGGSQNDFAAFICPQGYFIVDNIQGKIFLYNGRLQELPNPKTSNYFRDFLQKFYNEGEDNPFLGTGMTAGYDDKNNRLILTRKVRGSSDDTLNSQTLSYSFMNNEWISYHSYKPSYTYFNKSGIFFLDNGSKYSIYKVNPGTYGIYFDAVPYPYYVDLVFIQSLENKLWHDISWSSLVIGADNNPIHGETITHIMVYNNHQSTDLIQLNKLTTLPITGINTRNKLQYWSFNKLQDVVVNPDLPIIDEVGEPIISNINVNKTWFKKGRLLSRAIAVRLYHDNTTQRNVIISDLLANYKRIDR